MALIEGDVLHVTLVGRFGDYPPQNEKGYLAFAQSLHTPELYNLIKDAERVADITSYRFPSSVWRHYEHLAAFPEGFLVLGDAISRYPRAYARGTPKERIFIDIWHSPTDVSLWPSTRSW